MNSYLCIWDYSIGVCTFMCNRFNLFSIQLKCVFKPSQVLNSIKSKKIFNLRGLENLYIILGIAELHGEVSYQIFI